MRKRTKRKVYPLVNPVEYAINGACVASEEDLDKLREREQKALNNFRSGQATLTDWENLKALLNVAEAMSRAGVGIEVLSVCMQAQDHLIESAKRFQRIGKMGATGPALVCWQDLYEYHDLQRQSIARSEYEKFLLQAINRERSRAPEVIEITPESMK